MRKLRLRKRRHGESGQTAVEYLMLLALTFLVGYLFTTKGITQFTIGMIATIKGTIVNVVRNGDVTPGAVVDTGTPGHPGDKARQKALHL